MTLTRKFTSQVDGAEFEYRFNGKDLEIKADGCNWSDFIPEDKRAYSKEEYRELMALLKIVRNEPNKDFWWGLCKTIKYYTSEATD